MKRVDYKLKYQDLKLKFMNAVDTAFRLGYQQGMAEAQVQQAQQAQAAAQAQPGGAPDQGEEQADDSQEGQESQDEGAHSEHPDGSELDQHIAELESLLGKSEEGSEQYETLKKSLEAVKNIKKTKRGPSKYVKNMAPHHKEALSLQEKIVNDIMMKWEQEEKGAAKDIASILGVEGLIRKD